MSLPAKSGEDSDGTRVSSERRNRSRTQNAEFERAVSIGTEQMRSKDTVAIRPEEERQSREIQKRDQAEFLNGQQRDGGKGTENRGIKRRSGNEDEHGDVKANMPVLLNVEAVTTEQSMSDPDYPRRQQGKAKRIVDNAKGMAVLQNRGDKEGTLESVHVGNSEPHHERKFSDIDTLEENHSEIQEDRQGGDESEETGGMQRKTQQVLIRLGRTEPLPPRKYDIGDEEVRRTLRSTCTVCLRCRVHISCRCITTCDVCTTEENHCVSCLREIQTET